MGGACSTYEGAERFCWGNMTERNHLEDTGEDGRIMFTRIFRNWDVRGWTGSIWLGIGTDGGHL